MIAGMRAQATSHPLPLEGGGAGVGVNTAPQAGYGWSFPQGTYNISCDLFWCMELHPTPWPPPPLGEGERRRGRRGSRRA